MRYRFVDRILRISPNASLTATKSVSFEEYDLKSVFGEAPGFPALLLMECIFQAASWLEILSSGFQRCALSDEFEEAQFADTLRPGERAEITISVASRTPDGFRYDGTVMVAERRLLHVGGICAHFTSLESLDDPADIRTLFEETRAPHFESQTAAPQIVPAREERS